MLRTILARNQLSRSQFNKIIRYNAVKCLSSECIRRKHQNRGTLIKKTLIPQLWTTLRRVYSSYPSHIKVNLPALSPTMESGSIVSWEKKEGDKLSEGDLLCEIETDKATMGFETPEEGYLAKILLPAGSKGVPVGKLLCIIVENKEDVAAFKDFKEDSSAAPAPAAPAPAAPTQAAPVPTPAAVTPASPAPAAAAAPAPGRVYASPMAKRLAELKNIRLQGSGSGLYGSLKSGDLAGLAGAPVAGAPSPGKQAPAAPAPGQAFVDLPLSSMRLTIAKRLTQSKQTIPHYQLSTTVCVDKTLKAREKVNEMLAKEKADVKVSVNDYIIKSIASACKRVPDVNAHWMDTYIRQFSNVDVSVAVATPTGLITPIVFGADSRGIIDISRTVKALAGKAREGKLQPHEFQGGTVCVSNLGMFDITMFNAIINPPQSLIMACGGIQELVVPDKNTPEGWRVAKFVTFTASADHRVVDGAVGAQFMKAFKSNMEDPANIVL